MRGFAYTYSIRCSPSPICICIPLGKSFIIAFLASCLTRSGAAKPGRLGKNNRDGLLKRVKSVDLVPVVCVCVCLRMRYSFACKTYETRGCEHMPGSLV